jgi:hypothetical protein
MQDNRPRACRLGAVGAGTEQKQCTGDAIRHSGPAGGYAGVPVVFQWHTCVSRGSSAREQEVHFSPVLLHNQGYPKVCPDPLNLSNAGDSFAGISSLSSCSLFSPTRDLITLI